MNLRIFGNKPDDKEQEQINNICNHPAFRNEKIRIMPDHHAGAGRTMSRKEAKQKISIDEYKKSMEGIYSTSISENTLDESPFAYKPSEDIISQISEIIKIEHIIKPVYSLKAD